MPAERLSMRHLRELLRLRHGAGLRQANIAASLGLSQSSVSKYLKLAEQAGLLVDREATARENRRLQRRLQGAKLRQAAVVENVDLRSSRGLDRALFKTLATSDWVREHQHLAITGPTGT